MMISRFSIVVFGALTLGAAHAADESGVRISERFGFDPVDATEIVQKALDSGLPTIVFDRREKPWVTRPLTLRSNQTVVFEDGVELVAKRGEFKGKREALMTCHFATNVTIRGLGARGGTLRMWKGDYQDRAQYEPAEWRHCLRIGSSFNVLVENMTFTRSGGDGICIGRQDDRHDSGNIVIRRVTCDDNHRQGISACCFSNLLIEDCVLANTRGTMPQAGIDIEPNNPRERTTCCVLRNVVSTNNWGGGIEVVLHQTSARTVPSVLLFENCRIENCRDGAVVVGNHVRQSDIGRGQVAFENCSFRNCREKGLNIIGVPRNTVDVRFHDCSIVTTNGRPSVYVSAVGAWQGLPDRVDFGNLRVDQRDGGGWFRFGGVGLGPAPTGIRGKVERVKADSSVERIDIDAAWVAKHVPVSNGGLLPPPQQGLPAFGDVRAVDLKPGELVDLAPLATASYRRNYVFLVSRLGKVRFVLHQVKGKEDVAPAKKIQIRRILPDGKRAPIAQLPMPGFEPGEVSFEVKSNPGVYTLVIPSDGCPSVIDRSNVPIALDVTEANPSLYRIQERKPFSLWLGAPGGRRFAAAVGADSYYVFDVAMRDPDGMTFATGDTAATGLFVADVPDDRAKAGLWRLDFSPRQGRSCEYLRLATGGLPGLYFLSGEKYWLPRP